MTKPKNKFPRLGPIQIRLLKILHERPDGMTMEDAGRLGLFDDYRQHASALTGMHAKGLLKWLKAKRVWQINQFGRAMVNALEVSEPPPKYEGVITPPRRVMFKGTYDGAELRTQQARPGGNAPYTIPSLFSGQRVMRGVGGVP
jgi:hypothetical protein